MSYINTDTGEVIERLPRRNQYKRPQCRYIGGRERFWRDMATALAVYCFLATVVLAFVLI